MMPNFIKKTFYYMTYRRNLSNMGSFPRRLMINRHSFQPIRIELTDKNDISLIIPRAIWDVEKSKSKQINQLLKE